eukprot:7203355-Pyramimonas_sp.AAC.1
MSKHVPKYGIDPAKTRLKELDKLYSEFKKVHDERGMGGEVKTTVTEVDTLVKSSVEAAALLSKLLTTAKNNVPNGGAM